jgi:hypothetical protein
MPLRFAEHALVTAPYRHQQYASKSSHHTGIVGYGDFYDNYVYRHYPIASQALSGYTLIDVCQTGITDRLSSRSLQAAC